MTAPDNYGVLTCLLHHMLQSVVFTPPQIPKNVRESLYVLRSTSSAQRFGIFFLHDLEIEAKRPLREVAQADTLDVLSEIGVREMKRPTKKPALLNLHPPDATNSFPIGATPTFSDLADAIRSNPISMLRPLNIEAELNVNDTAALVFKHFTSSFWHLIKVLPGTRYDCLQGGIEEALTAWSLEGVHRQTQGHFVCRAVKPSSDFAVFTPHTQTQFEDRAEYFFPERNKIPEFPFWEALKDHGYLQILELAPDERLEVINDLRKLLALCQCLPTEANPKQIWEFDLQDGYQAVIVDVNPRYYRITGLRQDNAARSQPSKKRKRAQNPLLSAPAFIRHLITIHADFPAYFNAAVEEGHHPDRVVQSISNRLNAGKKKLKKASATTKNRRKAPLNRYQA